MNEPTDKDPHGMYAAEPSELAALQIQVKRVVNQCEAVIGEKAYTIPFGMAVSETIAELRKRAELAGAATLMESLMAIVGRGDDEEAWPPGTYIGKAAVDYVAKLRDENERLRKFRQSILAACDPIPCE